MRVLFAIIAIIVLLSVFGAITYYLSVRTAKCVRYFIPNAPLRAFLAVFCGIVLLIVLSFFRSMLPMPIAVKQFLGWLGSYCMVILIYYFLFQVLADLAVWSCGLIKPVVHTLTLVRFISGICVLGLTMVTVCCGAIHANHRNVVKYEIVIQDRQSETDWNIVLISDLHLGAVNSEKRLPQIVEEINDLRPDLVLIAGDFFDNDFSAIQDPHKAIETIQKLNAPHGIYACLGNHDAGKTYPQMLTFLETCGIKLLTEQTAVIDNELVIIGRADPSPIGGAAYVARRELGELVADVPEHLPIIVLDHNPANIDQYDARVDLILSGHTHKGQIFPANLVTGLMYTVDYGYYRQNENVPQVIVTSGVGTWGMPVRIGTDCEIVQISLQCQ